MSAEDELAIRALVARYADAVCRRDPDAWVATWAEDCRWDLGGGRVVSGRAETLNLWRTAIAKYDWVGQVVTSGLVEVEGDQARGWWYLIEFNQRAQGDGTLHLGHYDDEYVRTPGGWQFASRTMHMLYRGAMDPGVVTPLPPRDPRLAHSPGYSSGESSPSQVVSPPAVTARCSNGPSGVAPCQCPTPTGT
jgi:ketosteroid isomerase-like protein